MTFPIKKRINTDGKQWFYIQMGDKEMDPQNYISDLLEEGKLRWRRKVEQE